MDNSALGDEVFKKIWTGVIISRLITGGNHRVIRSAFQNDAISSLYIRDGLNYALADGLDFERVRGDDWGHNSYKENPRTRVYEHINRLTDDWYSYVALSIARAANRRVICSAYESRSGDKGLGWHSDEWDGIILQLRGEKIWNIKGKNGEKENYVLSQGDILFLPEGIEHNVETPRDSLHIVFAILKDSLETYSSSA